MKKETKRIRGKHNFTTKKKYRSVRRALKMADQWLKSGFEVAIAKSDGEWASTVSGETIECL